MKGESLYHSLPGTGQLKGPTMVNDFVTEFIRPTSNAEQVLNAMKPVYIDKSMTFVKEEEKLELKKAEIKKKNRKLTAREKRSLKIYDIPKEAHEYKLFEPLSALWQEYMERLLAQGTTNFEQKLIKADFHGAPFTVIQSKNPSYIGVQGIMVQETLSMFKLITKENRLKQIPKNSSVFTVHIIMNNKDYTLFGPQFIARPSERAVKKFKPKPSINL